MEPCCFCYDLSIYVFTVKDANKLLDVINEFEFWSGLRISVPKSLATRAMYGTGTARRQKGAKADSAKRKRDAGPDILNPQIQALGAMDEPLDADNTAKLDIKGQEAWRINLAMMNRQCRSFPRKNARLKNIFARDLGRGAKECTAALSHPVRGTPSVQHKKGRPSTAVSH